MSEEGDQDKPFDPTPRRLEQARQKGEIPRSMDLTIAGAYLGFLLFAFALGGEALTRAAAVLARFVERVPDTIRNGALAADTARAVADVTGALAMAFVLPIALAVAAVFVQRGWTFAPTKLAPKLNRVSPLSNAKQKFGRGGLFEFAKSTAKLTIYAAALAWFLTGRLPAMIAAAGTTPQGVIVLALREVSGFLVAIVVISAAIGAVDFLWQRAEHVRTNRMSYKELTDETKEAEGDPHLKQRRRQKGYDIATNRMLADVPKADVVIVNPTHYAVALKWERARGGAPVCVAKGTDAVAARIREVAAEAGVPVRRDPPTARALHATMDIGQEVPVDLYRPVAAAIRFAEDMRQRARRSWRS